MTTYGTIPTSSSPSTEYISRAKDRIKSNLAARRPWKQMLNIHALSFPHTLQEAISRVRTNTAFFRTNYAIIILLILFLSLLWHPISLIVFIIMMALWLFLYFLRDEPLVVFGRAIDDRIVLVVMGLLTLLFLFLTDATVNILVALLIGAMVMVVHAAVRKTDDLFVDEEGGESQGLMSAGGSGLPSSSS